MSISTYYTLQYAKGELKWLLDLKTTQVEGLAQGDLTEAETWAFDKINLWILKVAGETRGAEIIGTFVAMAAPTDVDPAIQHLACLFSSARILRLFEERNYINQGNAMDPALRRKDWTEVFAEAMLLAKQIEAIRKTVTKAGTVRRWGLGRGQQGPMVNGPMTGGSLFADNRRYVDVFGQSWTLPHRHPLDQQG